jgi:ATP-dependent Lhr-like helicase
MVIGRRTYSEELEPVDIPEKPYDALANQIAARLMKSRRIYFQELYEMFRKAYPYRDLTVDDIQHVAEYMHNRFPRFAWVVPEDKLIIKPRQSKPLYEYFFENLSMIPDEKHGLSHRNAGRSLRSGIRKARDQVHNSRKPVENPERPVRQNLR